MLAIQAFMPGARAFDDAAVDIRELAHHLEERIIPLIEQATVTEWKKNLSGSRSDSKVGVVSGTLRRDPEVVRRGVVAMDIIYGPVHEYGATIFPVNGDRLVFQVRGGDWVSVDHVVIPARPHRAPTVESMEEIAPKIAARECNAMMKAIADKITEQSRRSTGNA